MLFILKVVLHSSSYLVPLPISLKLFTTVSIELLTLPGYCSLSLFINSVKRVCWQ